MTLNKMAPVFALALAVVSTPASAQNAPAVPSASRAPTATAPATATADPAVGVTLSDGNPVGTMDKIEKGSAGVSSGAAAAALPLDKFGKGDKGPTIGFTKSQFEAAADGAKQQAAAK